MKNNKLILNADRHDLDLNSHGHKPLGEAPGMIKIIKKNLTPILLTAPFLAFAMGYAISFVTFQIKIKKVPNLIGKNLHQAMLNASSRQLSLRLLKEKEDDLLPEGTIIQQIPKPYQAARLNQSIFVIISKKPQPFRAPHFLGEKIPTITPELAKHGISSKIVKFKGKHSSKICIAQAPQQGEEIANKKMILYVSKGIDNLNIMPNLKNLSLQEADNLLQQSKNITLETYDDYGALISSSSFGYKIIDQKPMAGSIVDLNKPLSIQLLASYA